MALLGHPHVVRVIQERGEDDGHLYFVMEYLGGGNFQSKVLGGGSSVQEVHSVIQSVGQALQYAHDKNVIHRDVKPGNILLDGSGTAKLTDFDLVRANDSFVWSHTEALGSFVYAAPEVLTSGERAGCHSDVFSLGMTALFGWKGLQLTHEDFRQPDQAADQLPVSSHVKAVLKRATEWDPAHRFATIREFCEQLREAFAAQERSNQAESSTPLAQVVHTSEPGSGILNSIGMMMMLIPAGTFPMGSPERDSSAFQDEKPQHGVRITQPFYLGIHPVTQGEYRQVVKKNPSLFSGEEHLPVETVSWFDAVGFCNALSQKEGLPPFYAIEGEAVEVPDWNGLGYRLPTEAEWEYACRAGSTTWFSFGDDENALGQYAWYSANSIGKTHPVGEKTPNGFGLYDMHGNVWEWCWDEYADDYYQKSPADDPRGPEQAANRVIRGGSCGNDPRRARSAYRDEYAPEYQHNDLGFRLARGQSGR
jgi:formylglycine-generating enzyme required for sulfatase activity